MTTIPLDVVYEIIGQAENLSKSSYREILFVLACTCREFNSVIRPLLFREIRWPHENKHDPENGLHFVPQSLWPYVHHFRFDWPDRWPDQSPPLWGVKTEEGYSPLHLDKLEDGLKKMTNVSIFEMVCPFAPTPSLLRVIMDCPNIKDLRFLDTPLVSIRYPLLRSDAFKLDRLTLVPVGEALRVGEGPFEDWFRDFTYFTVGYRKQYRSHDPRFMKFYAMHVARPECLRHLQISTKYFSLTGMMKVKWPELELLILTGSTPLIGGLYEATMADVIQFMPKLQDLRLLLYNPHPDHPDSRPVFKLYAPPGSVPPYHGQAPYASPTVYSRIKYLALTNGCNPQDVLQYTTSLERLSVSAISQHPKIPIASGRESLSKMLQDLEVGGAGMTLKWIRYMLEDKLEVEMFEELGRCCPSLEHVEIELCGYKDGEAGYEWTDYGDVLSTYEHLKFLRIGIPFLGADSDDDNELERKIIRVDRRDCAAYLASRVLTLERIGFEYRTRTGNYSQEDRWLDYQILRVAEEVELLELGQTWYPIPEVWDPAPLHE